MYKLGIDIGGTFTDFTLVDEAAGEVTVEKEPTTADNPAVGALRGMRRLLDDNGVAVADLRTITLRSATPGGYGDPADRDPEMVERDVRMGYISAERAREVYGHDPE